jgi:hypothetical protein
MVGIYLFPVEEKDHQVSDTTFPKGTKMRRITGILSVGATLALIFSVAAGTATAATASGGTTAARVAATTVSSAASYSHWVSTTGAKVGWNPTGEHLGICDTAADGHHPVAFYYLSTRPGYEYRADASVGNGGCADLNFDLPESATIRYAACNAEGETLLNCSGFITESARG